MGVSSLFRRAASGIVQRAATSVSSYLRKYDVNWWVRHLNIAHQEDTAGGYRVGDPMRQHAWVAIGVDYCGRNFARAPFTLYNGDTVVESGADYDLFRDVNPFMSSHQLFRATESWLKIAGEAFWVYDPFAPRIMGHPKEIYVFPANKMEHRTDRNGDITQWVFKGDKQDIPFTVDQVVHFAYWNKWNAFRGVSPLSVLDMEMSMDSVSNKSNLSMIMNGSIPDGVLTSDQRVSAEEATEIRDRWVKEHGGPERKNRLHVLGQGVTYQAISVTAADMEFHTMKRWNRGTILARIGVPGILVGATDDKAPLSGPDTKFQKQVFWNETLMPDQVLIQDKLRTDYFRRFAPTLEGRFDNSGIPELQIDETERHTRLREDIRAGLLTPNEAREELDMEPYDGGDVAYMPMAMTPVKTEAERNEPKPIPPMLAAPPVEEPKFAIGARIIEKAPTYTKEFKDAHWKAFTDGWEVLEAEYDKKLKSWVYGIRKHVLEALDAKGVTEQLRYGIDYMFSDIKDVSDALDAIESSYWDKQTAVLREMSEPQFRKAMTFAEGALVQLFGEVDIPIAVSWSIFDTQAVEMVARRVDELSKITTTINGKVGSIIEDAITNGWSEKETADVLREKFNFASNRMATVARTEIGNVLQDSRIAGFMDVGVTKTEWLSSRDAVVRTHPYNHTEEYNNANGPVLIGEPFPNGLMYPNDPAGEAGNVINCRCVSLPVMGE